jgi:hypothetical protein
VAEVPDRTVDQLFQYRRKIIGGCAFHYGMIENIKNIDELTVIFINLVDTDA